MYIWKVGYKNSRILKFENGGVGVKKYMYKNGSFVYMKIPIKKLTSYIKRPRGGGGGAGHPYLEDT